MTRARTSTAAKLRRLRARNFLSLRDVDVRLGNLNVLVGPNASGKSNLLKVFQFLGDTARDDLGPAIERQGGYESLRFRGLRRKESVSIELELVLTKHARETSPDEYRLTFWGVPVSSSGDRTKLLLQRTERFKFKRKPGRGRRIEIKGQKFTIETEGERSTEDAKPVEGQLQTSSAGLSVLRKMGEQASADQWRTLADLFLRLRVFDPDVSKARLPAGDERGASPTLAQDAGNLAPFLAWLREARPEVFALLVDDLRAIVPSVSDLVIVPVGGSTSAVKVALRERPLSGLTDLAHASHGTVRALAILAMLHDPAPPPLTVVEEIDHGLHPWALDRIVDRLRSAKRRTQLLLATHSPALVNRLRPEEIIVCERDRATGASRIPSIPPEEVVAIAREDDLSLGELWFTGTLGGVLDGWRPAPEAARSAS